MRAPTWLLSLLIVQVAVTSAAAMDPAIRCIDMKNKAAARALRCLAREEQKAITGRPSDVAVCHAALARGFANAETAGGCAITGDLAAIQQRVDTVAAEVLDALKIGMVTSDAQKRCLIKQNNAAGGYAVCIANTLSKRLRGLPLSLRTRIGTDIGQCRVAAWRPFRNSDDCLVGFIERETPLGIANAAAGNFEGTDFRGATMTEERLVGANLRNADLSGVILFTTELTNADLTGANLSSARLGSAVDGANLSNVTWSTTRCPDGTHSDSNGSSPESCCGHLGGAVAAACSP